MPDSQRWIFIYIVVFLALKVINSDNFLHLVSKVEMKRNPNIEVKIFDISFIFDQTKLLRVPLWTGHAPLSLEDPCIEITTLHSCSPVKAFTYKNLFSIYAVLWGFLSSQFITLKMKNLKMRQCEGKGQGGGWGGRMEVVYYFDEMD